jgi:hypothetical protein
VLDDAQGANGNAVFGDWGRDPSTVYFLTVDLSQLQWCYWSIPVAGGTPRLLFALDGEKQTAGITFSTDGRRLFYTVSSDEADVWTMEFGGPEVGHRLLPGRFM